MHVGELYNPQQTDCLNIVEKKYNQKILETWIVKDFQQVQNSDNNVTYRNEAQHNIFPPIH